MKLKSICASMLCAATMFAGAAQAQSKKDSENWHLYKKAVINSAYTDSSKICNELIPITCCNKSLIDTMINGERYILTVSWKHSNYYCPKNLDTAQVLNTGPYDLWITVAPELKNKVKGTAKKDIDLRLEQMLGLPPDSGYYVSFFEFWVRPEDMYRPCPDNEISDKSCKLAFPANVSPEYVTWMNAQRISRFFGGDPKARYPWTELGYTYDWNPSNEKHFGCSEFVIKQNSTIYQRHFYSTLEYIYGK